MRLSPNIILSGALGIAAMCVTAILQAGAQDAEPPGIEIQTEDVIFAGGCFWCVESDFDKLDGVLETISGYTGGALDNPTYKQVSYETTGHYEAVRIVYDPSVVTYSELLEYYWRHVDPTDPKGQFCDKGDSYRTAVFVETPEERDIAEASKAAIESAEILADPIVTPILDDAQFWPAEEYHQNFHEKNPVRYWAYRKSCGRDARVKEVWKNDLKSES